MPLLDRSWAEEMEPVRGLHFFGLRDALVDDLSAKLSALGIETTFVARSPWFGELHEGAEAVGADSLVVLESLYGRLFGDPSQVSPVLSPSRRKGLFLIHPGSEWKLPNSAEGYALYYGRLWRHLARWMEQGLVARPAMCLNQVTDRGDHSESAMGGFLMSLRS